MSMREEIGIAMPAMWIGITNRSEASRPTIVISVTFLAWLSGRQGMWYA